MKLRPINFSPIVEVLERRTLLAGIWISIDEVMRLPTSGVSWEHLQTAAQLPVGLPNLQDQNENTDVLALAKALVGVRLADARSQAEARDLVMAAIGTESVTGTATIANPDSLETTVTFTAPGTYLFRLRADDGLKGDEDAVTVRVHAVGEAFTPTGDKGVDGTGQVIITGSSNGKNNDPDVSAGADQIVSINDVVTLRGSVSDDGLPDGTVTTRWEVVEARSLAVGRNLVSYVIAADLVGLSPDQDAVFREWLRALLSKKIDGRSLQETQEERPNNWGSMAAASRAAIAVYLGDPAELARTAQVFRGYLGDRSAYDGFVFDDEDLSWHVDPAHPVAINPLGATREGFNMDGAQPEEMRRGGPFQLPPRNTHYPWEGLQGISVTAEILHRAGYDAWEWQDRAVLRAAQFIHRLGSEPSRDDEWIPWVLNARYGTDFVVDPAAEYGKNIGWTAWTHQFGAPGTNRAPIVEAGPDQTITHGAVASLAATVGDDGLPGPPATVALQWSVLASPAGGSVVFSSPTTADTNVSISAAGSYLLQLAASDGDLTTTDTVAVTVVGQAEPLAIAFQDGVDGYAGTRDTRIRGDQPTANFGTHKSLEADGKPDHVTLLRWDVGAIPAGSTVISAAIMLEITNPTAQEYELYELLRPWDERAATFHLAAAGIPWGSPGASGDTDRGTEVLGTVTARTNGPVTVSLNDLGTAVVQKWVLDPKDNHGLVIQDLNDKTKDAVKFASRESPGRAPRLSVTYSLGPPSPPNHPPVSTLDAYEVDEDSALTIPAIAGVLTNDRDPEGDQLQSLLVTGPTSGALQLNHDGSFTYTPKENFNGIDSFTYRARDSQQKVSAATTATIEVKPVNDGPIAESHSVSTPGATPVSVNLLAHDNDLDSLTFTIAKGPVHGVLEGTAPNFIYTPAVDFVGEETVEFRASDGQLESAPATVTIQVSEVRRHATISFQDGVFPTTLYGGTRDTNILAILPDTTHGSVDSLQMDGKPDAAALVSWDVSLIPAGSTVNAVRITLNVVNTSPHVFNLYHLLRPWGEETATFNEFSPGAAWEVPGGDGATDRGSEVLGTVTSRRKGLVTIELNSAGVAVAQTWIDDPETNHGLVFQQFARSSGNGLDFTSREGSQPLLRPKLTIEYSTNFRSANDSITTLSAASTAASSQQNPVNRFDVNQDSVVAPGDALVIVNILNAMGKADAEAGVGASEQDGPLVYPDVTGDQAVTPLDVLMVVNYLNRVELDAAIDLAESRPRSSIGSIAARNASPSLREDRWVVPRRSEEQPSGEGCAASVPPGENESCAVARQLLHWPKAPRPPEGISSSE